jgi:hypothetical protein
LSPGNADIVGSSINSFNQGLGQACPGNSGLIQPRHETSMSRELRSHLAKAQDNHFPETQVSFRQGSGQACPGNSSLIHPKHETSMSRKLRSHSTKASDKHIPRTQVSVSQCLEQPCPKNSGINLIPGNLY